MTSANVVHFEIYDNYPDMNLLDSARQHALCKDTVGEKLVEWENKYPDAILCMRWPNHQEVDEYLLFEYHNGYDDGVLDEIYHENEREMILLRYYMKRKRERKIKEQERTIEYLRKELKKLREKEI